MENIVAQFVESQQSTNTEFRTTINDVKSQITKLTASMGSSQQEKGKFPSQPIQNPQVQNTVGTLSQNDGTFEHCKAITTLRSGKTIDKTIHPKDLSKEISKDLQNESKRDDDVIDEPNVPKADVVDVESDKDKAKHAPPAPYPYRLRMKKKKE